MTTVVVQDLSAAVPPNGTHELNESMDPDALKDMNEAIMATITPPKRKRGRPAKAKAVHDTDRPAAPKPTKRPPWATMIAAPSGTGFAELQATAKRQAEELAETRRQLREEAKAEETALLIRLTEVRAVLGPYAAVSPAPSPSARKSAPTSVKGHTGIQPPKGSRKARAGRLARRSGADLEATLAKVVAACKAAGKDGLRAEHIREHLGLDRREMPRVLKLGLDSKALKSKGNKRATSYSVR